MYQDWFPRSALELVFELESDRLGAISRSIPRWSRTSARWCIPSGGCASTTAMRRCSRSRCRRRLSWRIPTAFRRSAGRRTSSPGRWPICRISIAPTTRRTTARWCWSATCEPDAGVRAGAADISARSPAARRRRRCATREPEQLGERRLVLERPGQNPLLHIAYHAIARGRSARSRRSICCRRSCSAAMPRACTARWWRSSKLAVAIGGGWPEGFDPNVFTFRRRCRPAARSSEFEAALDERAGSAQCSDGVTEQELRRAKNIVAADFWRGVSTIDGKARLLGEYAVMHGDYRLLFAAPERLRARHARGRARDCAQVFDPRAAHRRRPQAAVMSGAHALDQPAAVGVRIPAHQRPAGQRRPTDPGAAHEVPLIAFEAVVRGGARLDPPQRAGVACADRRAADARRRRARCVCALPMRSRTRAAASRPRPTARRSLLHGQFLARDRELLLELLADALQRPRFENQRARQAAHRAASSSSGPPRTPSRRA